MIMGNLFFSDLYMDRLYYQANPLTLMPIWTIFRICISAY
uniref:Uncharacterized protein n=1 Tax=Rhizophora mucronata TaxID=61149 RepID=A0A2P2QRF1_RHIMU